MIARTLLILFLLAVPVWADVAEVFARWRDEFTAQPGCRGARVGFWLADSGGDPVFTHEADRNFVPASTLKLITAAAALEKMGANASLRTRVLWDGSVLTLVGAGDPELKSEHLDRLAGAVSGALPSAAVRELRVDSTLFRAPIYPPGWSWDDLSEDYAPEIRALTVDAGLLKVKVGPEGVQGPPWLHSRVTAGTETRLSVRRWPGFGGVVVQGTVATPQELEIPLIDSDLAAGQRFAQALRSRGLTVGEVTRGEGTGDLVAEHVSSSLSEMLARALSKSDNHAMECFSRLAGARPAALDDDREIRLADGSGLSRYNQVAPATLGRVLLAHPELAELCPAPGQTGTLKKRELPDVRAKTGTLGGVSGLAGRLRSGAKTYWFVLLINGHVAPGSLVKGWEDRLLQNISAEFQS